MILSEARREARVAAVYVGALELTRFSGSLVEGFDRSRPVSVDVRLIVWQGAGLPPPFCVVPRISMTPQPARPSKSPRGLRCHAAATDVDGDRVAGDRARPAQRRDLIGNLALCAAPRVLRDGV